MKRRAFIGGGVAGLLALRGLQLPARELVPVVEEVVAIAPAPISLIASGGLCAPLTPFYKLPIQGRPVRDALPSFTASRGGLEF